MVTTANMEKLRRLNFGIRALRNPMAAEVLCREIARYDATDAAQVCAWIRHTADMDSGLLSVETSITKFSTSNNARRHRKSRGAAGNVQLSAPLDSQSYFAADGENRA